MNETRIIVTVGTRDDCPPDAKDRIVNVFVGGVTELLAMVTEGMEGLIEAEVSVDPD